jgi:hypothetical protein
MYVLAAKSKYDFALNLDYEDQVYTFLLLVIIKSISFYLNSISINTGLFGNS